MSDPRVPDGWDVIAETHDGTEADLIQGLLRDSGVEAVILEARAAPGAWLTGSQPHWAPKSIAVPSSEADRALEVLDGEGEPYAADAELEPGPEEYGDIEATVGRVSEPFDQRPTMMGGLRVAAWIIAGLVVVSILFPQCSGIL